MSRFLSLTFSRVELADAPRLAPFLALHPQPLSGYTFATLVAWRDAFEYEFAFLGEALLISCCLDGERHLLQPIGKLTQREIDLIVREAAALPYPLKIVGVSDAFFAENPGFLEHFEKVEDRDTSNYVYRSRDLAELAGAKYAKKRNLLKQARDSYPWSVEPLGPERVDECRELLAEIEEPIAPEIWTPHGSSPALCEMTSVRSIEAMRIAEAAALDYTLGHLGELGQSGLIISVDGRPAGFSIFEPQSDATAVVHFERARRDKKGLYQVVNRVTAQEIAARGFELLNREEDLGDPGLRQAKSSYHPDHLERAWTLLPKAA